MAIAEDHVRFHPRQIDVDAGQPAQAFGEAARVAMVLGEALDHLIERAQAGRGPHSGLAHPAAQHLAHAPRALDELPRPRQHGTDRRAEPLRETEHHGIDGIGELPDVDPLRHSGIEDSSAVQMYGKAGVVGDLAQGGSLRWAEAGSAFAIVGVLEAEKSGYRLVDIRQADRAAYLIRLKAPVPAGERPELEAAANRRAPHSVLKETAGDFGAEPL